MDLQNLNKDRKHKRTPAVDLSTMVYGKIPPQDKEAERAVLGAILIEKRSLAEVTDLLKPEKFYSEAHQRIYQVLLAMDARSADIDEITVVMELKRTEQLDIVGGAYYITDLTRAVVSAAHIASHAKQVVECWMARQVIKVGGEMVAMGYEESQDPFELLDFAEKGIAAIMDSNDRGRITPISTALARSLTRLAFLRQQDSTLTGVSSGYDSLDRITHGWQSTDLIILAARPAVGKTAFALNLARNAAIRISRPVPVAFFSLEMSEGQIMERWLSAESEVFLERIKTGQLEGQEMNRVHNAAARYADSGIFIDDTPALNIFELRAKCRRLKNKHNIGFIIIDYLQLMSGAGDNRNGNREQEISGISRSLKALAKELSVPIIALSQLSRAVENRQDKTPVLADLRESGAIEQDADMVMFLYRPEYYGISADENGASTKGETHVKIAKHRNGSLDTVKLIAQLHIQRFVEFDAEPFAAPEIKNPWRSSVRRPYNDREDDII